MIIKVLNYNFNKYIIFTLILSIGVYLHQDSGFNIDEKFHRNNGFYWLSYISEFLNIESLKLIADKKLESITGFTLSPIEYYNKYSIIFDVPAAFFEVILNTNNPVDYYRLRHLLIFIYYFFGLVFFYKLLINRFRNNNLAIFGVLFLFLTPRVFGDSFQNNKDIIFLVFLIISHYYFFKIIDNLNIKNLAFFSFYAAIATTIRMFGVIFPFFFVIFLFFQQKLTILKKINYFFIFLFLYIFFTIITWPLLWENTLKNFISYFEIIDDYFDAKVFYLNNYYKSNILPYNYLIVWIYISTPIFNLITFTSGCLMVFNRFFKKYLNLKEKTLFPDFWRGKKEQKDTFILLFFLSFLVGLIFFNIKLYNSWRLGYFLYFYITYFSVYCINYISIHLRKKIKLKLVFIILIITSLVLNFSRIILYHPYQSLYFNIFTTKKIKNSVEVDYTGLSSFQFLKEILEENKDRNIIRIGVASWYPLWRVAEIFSENDRKKILILSNKNNFEADYIYSNNISEVDKKLHNKYEIPKNFYLYKNYTIDGVSIYKVYKKKL